MKFERIDIDTNNDVFMNAFLQDVGGEFKFNKRPAMIICPGGGYMMLSDREAEIVAMPYVQAGYQVFVLHYTVGPQCSWPKPFEDFKNAYKLICDNSKKWSIDSSKICTLGFSAGGHLAGYAAVSHEINIAAAVLIYPALLDNILKMLGDDFPEIPPLVDSQTSPVFLAAARDDKTVNINNTIQMQEALRKNDIDFESHIYSYGGHAFAMGSEYMSIVDTCPRIKNWVLDSVEWLEETIGKITKDGICLNPRPAICTADNGACLSAFCSLNRIMQCMNEDVEKIVEPIFKRLEEHAALNGQDFQDYCQCMKTKNLVEISDKLNIDLEVIKKVHFELRNLSPDEIPNF